MGSQFQKPLIGTQVNWGHPLSRGLVGCWLMNEGAGDRIYDLSLNGNDGVFVNDPAWVAGQVGLAIDFDGGNDSVDCGSFQNFTEPFTVLVKAKANLATGNADICEKFSALGVNFLILKVSAEWRFYCGGVSTPNSARFSPSLMAGAWADIVGVWNGTDTLIYFDGVYRAKAVIPLAPTSTATNLLIGRRYNNTSAFPGQISSVLIYNRTLSAEEISELYLNPYGMFEHYPIWKLAEFFPTIAGIDYPTKQSVYNFLTQDSQYVFKTKPENYNFYTQRK